MLLAIAACLLAGRSTWADSRTGLRSGVAGCGDINGDGVPDLAVASRDHQHPDRVWVVSGTDGTVLRTLGGKDDRDGFGSRIVGVGDLDADGTPDIAVGAKGDRVDPYTQVLSGKTGQVLVEFDDCGDVATVRDIDRDGRPDLLRTAIPGAWNGRRAGAVVLRFGQKDKQPFEIRPAAGDVLALGQFGNAVCWTGDVDDDGLPDIATTSVKLKSPGDTTRNAPLGVGAYSSKDGRQIWSFRYDDHSDADGSASILRHGGDVDGDGFADLVVVLECHYALTLSGKTGALLHKLPAALNDSIAHFGSSLDVVGDVDKDGILDWVIAANEQHSFFEMGFARLISGKAGKLLLELEHSRDFGFEASTIGDVDKDGTPDVAVLVERERDRGSDLGSISAVKVLSGKDGREVWLRTLPDLRRDSTVRVPK